MTGNNIEPINSTSTNVTIANDRDSVLIDFVTWANRGIKMGLTLSIKGVIYSGQLISGASWCDAMIKHSEASGSHEETIKALVEYYTSLKEGYYGSTEVDRDLIGYIHLESLSIYKGGSTETLPNSVWRFKISEIDGFTVGQWTKN